MNRLIACAALAITLSSANARAADCGIVLDDLSRAISGKLNMSMEKKAALMRMGVSSYDHCMAGDTKSSDSLRAMIMSQINESLGGR